MEWTFDDIAAVYLLCGLVTGAWQAVDLLAENGKGIAQAFSGIPAIDQLPWLPRLWLVMLVVGNLVMWPWTLLWALRRWMGGPLRQRLQAYERRLATESSTPHDAGRRE